MNEFRRDVAARLKEKAPKPPAPTKPTPAKPKPPSPGPFPGVTYFRPGAKNKYVTLLGAQLIKKGYGRFYSVGAGPTWTGSDRAAVKAFQRAQGWSGADADGYPGRETWRRLFS
ncbi:peptidoglycan-binding protein [Streptomyces sp. CFMR 7]|uniref:peptidoglycan-binding protein n=1 Tax=Streptomyces sp. CFMR 7 TaxID=1649184 RepID=UPI0021B6D408|nr:peptidoglycan-binding protein [Streptomyces sp. CFMR 7]